MSVWQPTSLLAVDACGVARRSLGLSGLQSAVVIVPWVVVVISRPRSCRSLWASFSNPASFCSLATWLLCSGGSGLFHGPSVRLSGDTTTVWVEGREWVHVRLVKIRWGMSPGFSAWLLLSCLVFSEDSASGVFVFFSGLTSSAIFSESGCCSFQRHGFFFTQEDIGPDFLL